MKFLLIITLLLSLSSWVNAQEQTSGDTFESHWQQAVKYQEENNYDQAIVEYTKAIEINPTFVDAYKMRAAAYAAKQNYTLAWVDVDVVRSFGDDVNWMLLQTLEMYAPREEMPTTTTTQKDKFSVEECLSFPEEEQFSCFVDTAIEERNITYCLKADVPLECLDEVATAIQFTESDCEKMRELKEDCLSMLQ